MGLKSAQHYIDRGYTVDDTCYPWVAYKGPRFNPTEWDWCLTSKESYFLAELCRVFDLSTMPPPHELKAMADRLYAVHLRAGIALAGEDKP